MVAGRRSHMVAAAVSTDRLTLAESDTRNKRFNAGQRKPSQRRRDSDYPFFSRAEQFQTDLHLTSGKAVRGAPAPRCSLINFHVIRYQKLRAAAGAGARAPFTHSGAFNLNFTALYSVLPHFGNTFRICFLGMHRNE
ncbi:hypothetical protein EVAR_47273_1 [Eumeta japonica]|uniref:Uncharacterized protein n=1 Tax=Eumeta variegata TaxID=151549 RepID=A0A4C1XG39_EUMVA|nr:hypothetical protein EVAR_47273_1 [Eumeta japonica]